MRGRLLDSLQPQGLQTPLVLPERWVVDCKRLDHTGAAVRELVRAREEAVRACRNTRPRLEALLLRSGTACASKATRTAERERWLASLKMAQPVRESFGHCLEPGERCLGADRPVVAVQGPHALGPAAIQVLIACKLQ